MSSHLCVAFAKHVVELYTLATRDDYMHCNDLVPFKVNIKENDLQAQRSLQTIHKTSIMFYLFKKTKRT